MLDDLQNERFEDFDARSNSNFVKWLFPRFNVVYLQMNSAILQNNKRKINEVFDRIDSISMTYNQNEDVYMKALNYYVSVSDKRLAHDYLEKINTLNNAQMKLEANRICHVYIDKDDSDLPELLEEVADLPDARKGVHEFLISIIYKNKGDKENQKKYEALSRQHMELLDAEIADKLKSEGKL